MEDPLVGVLALQGAFEEHQHCLKSIGCRSRQVRTPLDLEGLDGIILPGGESTAMGLIGTTPVHSSSSDGTPALNMWQSLQIFAQTKPVWGTCAGMILLAERCIGTSAVIQGGQALIGGVDITVARNYFGSQVSSFEMPTPAPPSTIPNTSVNGNSTTATTTTQPPPFPGVFIRAPAILSAGPTVQVLGKVVATPCRQAAVTLDELERKIAAGENVVSLGIADALDRDEGLRYKVIVHKTSNKAETDSNSDACVIALPGAADRTNAREVICATRTGLLLCTAFHPELTEDYRWHEYFVQMIRESKSSQ